MNRNDAQRLKDMGLWPLLYTRRSTLAKDFKEPTPEEAQAALDRFREAMNTMKVVFKGPAKTDLTQSS